MTVKMVITLVTLCVGHCDRCH